MSAGTDQRAAYLDPPVSRDSLSLDQQPEVQKAMRGLVVAIRASPFFVNDMLEPILGALEAVARMAVASDGLWRGYGTKARRVYALFINIDGKI
jgi:hypothetical protein